MVRAFNLNCIIKQFFHNFRVWDLYFFLRPSLWTCFLILIIFLSFQLIVNNFEVLDLNIEEPTDFDSKLFILWKPLALIFRWTKILLLLNYLFFINTFVNISIVEVLKNVIMKRLVLKNRIVDTHWSIRIELKLAEFMRIIDLILTVSGCIVLKVIEISGRSCLILVFFRQSEQKTITSFGVMLNFSLLRKIFKFKVLIIWQIGSLLQVVRIIRLISLKVILVHLSKGWIHLF